MITKMTEHYILCGDIQIPTEKNSSVSKRFQRSQNFTSSVGTFKFQQKKSSLVLKWFQRSQNHAFFVETIKFQLKNQFSIEMIQGSKNFTFFVGTFKSQQKNTDHYSNDYKDDRPRHSLLVHSNFNWKKLTYFVGTFKFQLKKKQFIIQMTSKMTEPYIVWGTLKFQLKKKQFSIEMISKMTDPNILSRDIQNPTEKDSSVFKWFQIWRNLTSFVGTFKFQLKKTVQYWTDYKDDRTLHSLWGHSNSDRKKQFSIETISKITELYILCGDIQVSTEKKKTVQCWNDFKDDRAMHSLWRHWCSNWKISSASKWFKLSKNFTSFVGTFKSQLKNTDYYWNDHKDDSPLHSFFAHSCFNWKKLTYFIGTFKIQLEKTVQYPNDFKDDRTLHHLWGHSNSNWKRQFSIEMISKIHRTLHPLRGASDPNWKRQVSIEMITKMTEPYILCGDIQIPTEKTVQYQNDFTDHRTIHPL